MISQRVAKNSLIILSDANQAEHYAIEVGTLLTVFRESHEALKIRQEKLGHRNKALDSLFQSIEPAYLGLTEVAQKIARSSGSDELELRSELLLYESTFLPLMHLITLEFEHEADYVLASIRSNTITSNYIIVLTTLLSAGGVLLLTLGFIKGYSEDLDKVSDQLLLTLESEQDKVDRFEFLMKTINVGIWEKSISDQKEKWSDKLYEILGYQPGDIEGTGDQFMRLVSPNDIQKLVDASESSIKTGLSSTIELRVKTKSGAYKWLEATGNVRRDKSKKVELLIGAVLDITDRKTLEMQLKSFIDRAPAAIAMFDTQIRYIAASHQWTKDYGIQDQTIIGKSHYEVFPEIGDAWKAIHQNCLKRAIEVNDEDPFERPDGTIQYIKWEVRPWYIDKDEIGGILMFSEDVTKSILEKEELRRAKRRAENASKAKEEFLATMNHEIRTPLNAINGISYILLMDDPRPDQIEQLNLLRFSGENLLTLINDILDVSKIESGKIELNIAPFDFRDLIQNVKNSMAFRAKENLVSMVVSYEKGIPSGFEGDVTRLTQIMYNLISNAIKFTQNGEVLISVKQLDTYDHFFKIRVSVKDTGIGVAEENLDKIFRSFEQAETGTTRKYGGTGLGLFITSKLLEMMNSELKVESELGEGSNFYFDIELKNPENFQNVGARQEMAKVDLSTLDLNILLVEDNTANQTIFKSFLKRAGISCDVALDGQIGVDKIKSKRYDMVFMDLQMPVMDGFIATQTIRVFEDDYFKRIPIIALPADIFNEIEIKILAVGMNDYLSKPFKPARLYELISRHAGVVIRNPTGFQLEDKINIEPDGDIEFKREFTGQCLANYIQFLDNFRIAISEGDIDLLKKIAHKIKGLNGIFALQEFQSELDALILEDRAFPVQQLRIERVINLAELIIEELTKINEQ